MARAITYNRPARGVTCPFIPGFAVPQPARNLGRLELSTVRRDTSEVVERYARRPDRAGPLKGDGCSRTQNVSAGKPGAAPASGAIDLGMGTRPGDPEGRAGPATDRRAAATPSSERETQEDWTAPTRRPRAGEQGRSVAEPEALAHPSRMRPRWRADPHRDRKLWRRLGCASSTRDPKPTPGLIQAATLRLMR